MKNGRLSELSHYGWIQTSVLLYLWDSLANLELIILKPFVVSLEENPLAMKLLNNLLYIHNKKPLQFQTSRLGAIGAHPLLCRESSKWIEVAEEVIFSQVVELSEVAKRFEARSVHLAFVVCIILAVFNCAKINFIQKK